MVDPVKQAVAQEAAEETIDTSDPIQVNTQRKKYARTRADRLKFVAAAMEHEQGRAWFYDILVRCRVVGTPFSEDPYKTAFNCGMQNIGLQVLDDIQTASPDGYNKMIQENKSKNG